MCDGPKRLLSKSRSSRNIRSNKFARFTNTIFIDYRFMAQGTTLPGDILLITAFISYIGCFTKQFRLDLINKLWLPFLRSLEPPIPITEGLDALSLLTDDTTVALWQNEGLPSDRMSIENATILTNSERWPLMIDPQLQGRHIWKQTRFQSNIHYGTHAFRC